MTRTLKLIDKPADPPEGIIYRDQLMDLSDVSQLCRDDDSAEWWQVMERINGSFSGKGLFLGTGFTHCKSRGAHHFIPEVVKDEDGVYVLIFVKQGD